MLFNIRIYHSTYLKVTYDGQTIFTQNFFLAPLFWAVQLVPEEEVSPVDAVEDEEEEGGEVKEEPVHLCIVIILLPGLLLRL